MNPAGLGMPQWLLLLAVAAVAAFWIIGAHNRLVSLRTDIGAAWGRVDDARRQRAAAADPLLLALRGPLAAEHGALDAVQAALADNARAAALLAAKPVLAAHAAQFVASESALAAAAARLLALLDHSSEASRLEAVAPATAAWREADTRMSFARQLYNEAAESYNAAVRAFPTRLLVAMFRFAPAGRL